jgi:hypothetical protein
MPCCTCRVSGALRRLANLSIITIKIIIWKSSFVGRRVFGDGLDGRFWLILRVWFMVFVHVVGLVGQDCVFVLVPSGLRPLVACAEVEVAEARFLNERLWTYPRVTQPGQ